MPRNVSQYGVMSPSREDDGDLISLEPYFAFAFDKESVELCGIAAFKAPQLLG